MVGIDFEIYKNPISIIGNLWIIQPKKRFNLSSILKLLSWNTLKT